MLGLDSDFTFVLMILFLVIVVPIWLVLHYGTRNSANKKLSSKDEIVLDEIHDNVRKMEDRIHTLERILDADAPEWRNSNERSQQ